MDSFFGFKSQSTEDDVLTMASLGLIKYDRECLNLYLKYYDAKQKLGIDSEEESASLSTSGLIGILVAIIAPTLITLWCLNKYNAGCFNPKFQLNCKKCCKKIPDKLRRKGRSCRRRCRRCCLKCSR